MKIFEMPPHLRDLIAAGEVVERPGSVVKELTENSIDAGARSVTVEIKNGGMSSIRVTDDGCGMSPDDAERAFLRHATSKLRDERGLEAIGTLGFRGEALAAIASVARVELITRERGGDEGTRMMLEAGEITGKAPAGAPEGTTVIVRDLFFNTPARLKFMKNDRAEGGNVTVVMTRLALSHPEISIRYIRDGAEAFHTPGDGRLQSAVYCTLGRDLAKGLLPVESENDGVKVTGYVSAPSASRGNRAWQFFFINGRFIRSKTLQAAVEQAYKNSLFTGRFPVCLINVELGLSKVDVNVHPTKMEVRFADERAVFNAVYWAARSALEREAAPPELSVPAAIMKRAESERPPVSPAAPPNGSVKPRDGFYKKVSAESFRSSYAAKPPETVTFRDGAPDVAGFVKGMLNKRGDAQTSIPLPKSPPPVSVTADDTAPETDIDFRYIGEALSTYLIVERGGSVFFIDKHAAHERVLFDALKAGKRDTAAQLLLTPVVCNIGETAADTLMANAELLGEFGFELSELGGGSVAIREAPADVDLSEPEALLEELAEKLTNGGRRSLDGMRDDLLHTIACKAAIKAGKASEPEEVMKLIARVLSGEVRYCPHGRPVSMELTRAQLDRSFKRS